MTFTTMLSLIDRIGYEIFLSSLSLMWQSSILFLCAVAASWLLRHRSDSVRHAIWLTLLVILPVLPAITWFAGSIGSPVAEIKVLPYQQVYNENVVSSGDFTISARQTPQGVMEKSSSPKLPETAITHQLLTAIKSNPWAVFLVAYMLIASALLLLTIAAGWRIHSWIHHALPITDKHIIDSFETVKARLGITREIGIVESDEISSPITFGAFSPVVLLPIGFTDILSDDDINAVLVHELSHIKRNDPLSLTLTTVIRALFFFHPLVWFAAREVSYYAESACDNAVVSYTGAPHSYADMLNRVAMLIRRRSTITEYAVGIVATKKILLRRMYAILENSGKMRKLSKLGIACVFIGALLSVSFAASVTISGKDNVPKLSEESEGLLNEVRFAITTGDTTTVRTRLQNNPDLKNIISNISSKLFTYHLQDDKRPMFQILLDEGVQLDVPDRDGMTALHTAVQHNYTEGVRLMLENNINIESKDANGRTPLDIATENSSLETADVLLEYGAELSIHRAAKYGKIDYITKLLGENPNAVNARNYDGKTALHALCDQEKKGFVMFHMEKYKKAQIKEEDRKEKINEAHFEIFQLLLRKNADVSARDDSGWMPIHYVVKNGRIIEMELLIQNGASVNALLEDKETPLHLAAWHNRQAIVKNLLEKGAEINAVNEYGTTAYDWAKVNGHTAIIDILTNSGAGENAGKLNSTESWEQLLQTPYSAKAFSSHMLAIGNPEIEELSYLVIRKAIRVKRVGGDNYHCFEFNTGKKSSHILILDSHGKLVKVLEGDFLYVKTTLFVPNHRVGIDYSLVYDKINNGLWLDALDINGDGFGDIEICPDNNTSRIYSSHTDDIPIIFEAVFTDTFKSEMPFDDMQTGQLFLQYCDEEYKGLRVTAVSTFIIEKKYTAAVMDSRTPPREVARYEWDADKGAFTGPKHGPNDLWTVNFPELPE